MAYAKDPVEVIKVVQCFCKCSELTIGTVNHYIDDIENVLQHETDRNVFRRFMERFNRSEGINRLNFYDFVVDPRTVDMERAELIEKVMKWKGETVGVNIYADDFENCDNPQIVQLAREKIVACLKGDDYKALQKKLREMINA